MAWQIIGHSWAIDLLSHGLDAGQIAHAYLFTGPAQIGKTTLAKAFAQALNCSQQDPPCGQCASCLKVAKGNHPDVHLIQGEGAGGSIKIEQVRALQREAALKPYEGRYRVFILRQADRATAEAADSLLKTLEEPPSHVVLILTASHARAMRPTVISRCQRLDLRPVTNSLLTEALLDRGAPPAEARLLARLSGGCAGWALGAWNDQSILTRRQQNLDQLVALLTGDRVERLEAAATLSRDSNAARQTLDLWMAWWRDLLLFCGSNENHLVHLDRREEFARLAPQIGLTQSWAALKALEAAATHLDANVNTRLALENFLLKLPRPFANNRHAQPFTLETAPGKEF
jgi:DNA polymerase-3 subunit delta'